MKSRARVQTEAERLSLARQIRAAGVPIYIEEDDGGSRDLPDGLTIYNTGAVFESNLFDFHDSTGVVLRVGIGIKLGAFAIAAFELELPWSKQVSWLPDPLEYDGFTREYRFSGMNTLEFPREDVLNHRANVNHIFRRGDSLVGSLLGVADEPIPDECRHGRMVPAFLTISDQFWRTYRSSVSFWTDRSLKRRERRRPRSSKGIFDYPDPPQSAPTKFGK
jgi:hypothetical protein